MKDLVSLLRADIQENLNRKNPDGFRGFALDDIFRYLSRSQEFVDEWNLQIKELKKE